MEGKKDGLVSIKTYEELLKALQEKAESEGKTDYRISKDSGLQEKTVNRMMSGETEAKFSTVMKAFEALGIEVYIKIQDDKQS